MRQGLFLSFVLALGLLPVAAQQPQWNRTLPYTVFSHYFEKNNSGLSGDSSYLVFENRAQFDRIFGAAATMGGNQHFLPDDVFQDKLVIAVIRRGTFTLAYKVDRIAAAHQVLTVEFSTEETASPTAHFSSPLLLSVPREEYHRILFIENGRAVQSILLARAEQ